jgi:hypothetical protein
MIGSVSSRFLRRTTQRPSREATRAAATTAGRSNCRSVPAGDATAAAPSAAVSWTSGRPASTRFLALSDAAIVTFFRAAAMPLARRVGRSESRRGRMTRSDEAESATGCEGVTTSGSGRASGCGRGESSGCDVESGSEAGTGAVLSARAGTSGDAGAAAVVPVAAFEGFAGAVTGVGCGGSSVSGST